LAKNVAGAQRNLRGLVESMRKSRVVASKFAINCIVMRLRRDKPRVVIGFQAGGVLPFGISYAHTCAAAF
jgi:hypothetical protein